MNKKKGFLSNLFGGEKSGGCCGCSCNSGSCNPSEERAPFVEGAMSIKILGPGCKNCDALAENTKSALSQIDLQANIEKVTDLSAITEYGVMSTPALVVDEKVVSYGRVLKPNEIINILENL